MAAERELVKRGQMDYYHQPEAVGGDDRFAGWAQQYEHDVLSRLLTVLQLRAAARLRLTATDRFLDVGCATGAAVRDASATVRLAVGVDRCAAMVWRARALAEALPGTAFVVADAEQLPFPPTFSAVLSTTTLRHLADPAGAVCEMARVLLPGGRIVVADFVACGDKGTGAGGMARDGPNGCRAGSTRCRLCPPPRSGSPRWSGSRPRSAST